MQASFISQILQRLASESPAFFRKLQLITGVIALLMIVAYSMLRAEVLQPTNAKQLLAWMENVGLFFSGAFASSLTGTKKADLVDPEVKQAVKSESSRPM